ncbi:MAG: ABC transporter permease [Anaerolineae bacterium]
MKHTWLVIKHEIAATLGKPSFWLTTFVFPLLILGFSLGSQLLAFNLVEKEQHNLTELLSGQVADQPMSGYVDHAGLIQQFPETFPRQFFQAYPNEEAARAALEGGEIDQYYVIAADYMRTGEVTLIQEQFSPFQVMGDQNLMQYLITYNLIGDQTTTRLLFDPIPQVEEEALAPPEPGEARASSRSGEMGSVVAYGVLFIFFFLITMSSGFMLKSVAQEKENRVIEVLLLSLKPRELMLGKILGLGIVGLLQMAIWGGAAFAVTGGGLTIAVLAALSNISLPAMFFVWSLFYFLLGYLTFASALGAIGALAPNTREGSQFTFIILLPLMIPLWLNTAFMEAPNGPLAVGLSLFPLSSPVAMMARLAVTNVPLGQILLSLGLLAGTTYGFVLLAARLFRADTLLSGEALNAKRLFRNVREAILGS